MNRLSEPLLTPQSVTNVPKMLGESNAIERMPRPRNRAGIVLVLTAVALSIALIFTGGVVVGMKMTNDYYQEVTR